MLIKWTIGRNSVTTFSASLYRCIFSKRYEFVGPDGSGMAQGLGKPDVGGGGGTEYATVTVDVCSICIFTGVSVVLPLAEHAATGVDRRVAERSLLRQRFREIPVLQVDGPRVFVGGHGGRRGARARAKRTGVVAAGRLGNRTRTRGTVPTATVEWERSDDDGRNVGARR